MFRRRTSRLDGGRPWSAILNKQVPPKRVGAEHRASVSANNPFVRQRRKADRIRFTATIGAKATLFVHGLSETAVEFL